LVFLAASVSRSEPELPVKTCFLASCGSVPAARVRLMLQVPSTAGLICAVREQLLPVKDPFLTLA
jgi:hypothetical protein